MTNGAFVFGYAKPVPANQRLLRNPKRDMIWVAAAGPASNLLPLPPLDGGRIVTGLLPDPLAWRFAQLERWGFIILLGLMFTHILDAILYPLVKIVVDVIVALVSVIF